MRQDPKETQEDQSQVVTGFGGSSVNHGLTTPTPEPSDPKEGKKEVKNDG